MQSGEHQLFGITLNEPQYNAVTHTQGAVLVVAGAGSGKTRVITTRIAYLMAHHHVPGNSIVALTFTNKAAREMKERIAHYVGNTRNMPYVGTFHAYALYLLRSNPHLMPFETFSIFDGDDQVALVKKILKHHGLEKQLNATNVLYQISSIKNSLNIESALAQNTQLMSDIFHAYEKEKTLAQSLDFDDLLLVVYRLFVNNFTFRAAFQARVRHLLVDEYQDTNIVQHELLKMMCLDEKGKLAIDSICAVGDEDQSVYSWRGAHVGNMLTFTDDFAPVTKVNIEQNYRSVQPILEAANHVITNNTMRNPKSLWSTRNASNRILALTSRSEHQEADAISLACSLLPKNGSTAILYRTHYQSRVIEEALARKGIPYRIIGGITFYARKEIKDMLSYLRLIVNPHDRVSFLRVLNTPTRGLGAQCEEQLQTMWYNHEDASCHELIDLAINDASTGISGKRAQALKEFSELLTSCSPDERASDIVRTILSKTQYLAFLRTQYEQEEAQEKIDNIQEFLRSTQQFEEQALDTVVEDHMPRKNVMSFLHAIALLQEKIEQATNEEQLVNMMTLHAAKGLEFNTVFIVGLEEGLFPSTRNLSNPELLEEERRLFYVGITRAKDHLVLSRSYYRHQFGQINDQPISRFLTEIPSSLLKHHDISEQQLPQVRNIFNAWLNGSTLSNPFNRYIPAQPATLKHKPAPVAEPIAPVAAWKKNQSVMHPKFGVGLVQEVDERGDGTCYITAKFKSGEKKLLSSFLVKV